MRLHNLMIPRFPGKVVSLLVALLAYPVLLSDVGSDLRSAGT